VLSQKIRMAIVTLMTAVFAAGGAAMASGAVGLSFPNEDAQPKSLIVSDGSSPVIPLSPRMTADMRVSVTNPNNFALTITSVVGAGAITSDKGVACDGSTGVTFTNTSRLHRVVGAHETVTFSLSGAMAMSNASDTSCQDATFTIPLSVTASSYRDSV
jgi:ABC-type phosphate transport system substrate-binding protein